MVAKRKAMTTTHAPAPVQSFRAKVVRLAGTHPVTNQFIPRDMAEFTVSATDRAGARKMAIRQHGLTVHGQELEVHIDGRLELGNW